jgi:amino acid transporter
VEASGIRIQHPNREKPQSKATKSGVILLLIVSAALIALVFIGGLSEMNGAQIVSVAYVAIYLVMAYFVARWSRGVLPMAAALAIIFTTFAAVAAPAWLARDKPGLEDPLLPSGLLGLLTFVLLAVQVLLILFAMRGFQQEWNVEVEVREDGQPHDSGGAVEDERRSEAPQGTAEHETYDAPPEGARPRHDEPAR